MCIEFMFVYYYLQDDRPPFAIWPSYVQQDQHVVQPILI